MVKVGKGVFFREKVYLEYIELFIGEITFPASVVLRGRSDVPTQSTVFTKRGRYVIPRLHV